MKVKQSIVPSSASPVPLIAYFIRKLKSRRATASRRKNQYADTWNTDDPAQLPNANSELSECTHTHPRLEAQTVSHDAHNNAYSTVDITVTYPTQQPPVLAHFPQEKSQNFNHPNTYINFQSPTFHECYNDDSGYNFNPSYDQSYYWTDQDSVWTAQNGPFNNQY